MDNDMELLAFSINRQRRWKSKSIHLLFNYLKEEMACIQASGSAEAYHAKHKSVVTEMFTIAHNMAHKHGPDKGATTYGCIMNNVNGACIKFFEKHEWSGHEKEPFPQFIANVRTGTFVHVDNTGTSVYGDKSEDEAAVVYADEAGAGWLLAWSVKACSPFPNKVYVETRQIEYYKRINWDIIKAKLDASSDTSYYRDGNREAFAKISEGNNAALGACYTVSEDYEC